MGTLAYCFACCNSVISVAARFANPFAANLEVLALSPQLGLWFWMRCGGRRARMSKTAIDWVTKQCFGGLLLLVACCVGAAPYTVVGRDGTLRSGPGSDFGVVATLTRGAVVDAIGRRGNWLHVRTGDAEQAWLFRGLAQPTRVQETSENAARQLIDEWVGDYWLFAIGIDRYTVWPKLRNAVRDARAVVELLTQDFGFDPARVVTLYDGQATEENIFREFLRLKDQMKSNDSLLIYYAGHGVLDEFDTASWVPVDARENAMTDYIATDRINRILGKLPARHVFLVADACYSGSLFNRRGAASTARLVDDRYFRENVRRYSRQALTSGGTEPVLDDGGRNQHSIFAHHFLSELRRDGSPYVAASTLSLRVQRRVAQNSAQEPRWDHLVDTGDESGEFFFLRSPSASADAGGDMPDATSNLTLHTYPFGAALSINGEPVGTAPVTLTGLAGTVRVEAELDGYNSAVESVRIRYDREQTLILRLSPTEGVGSLVLTTQPVGAWWYLDGAYMGMTPDRAVDILAGTHVLAISKEGYPQWRQTVRILQDQVVALTIDLAAGAIAQGGVQAQPGTTSPVDRAAVVAAARASVANVSRATSESHSQRQEQGIDQLEKLLGEFVGAYQLRDAERLAAVSELSTSRQAFVERLFKAYRDIELHLVSLEVTDTDATATLKIEKLVRHNGDQVIPASNWSSAYLLINRNGDRWGKIQWH